jgi:hypothetical protein
VWDPVTPWTLQTVEKSVPLKGIEHRFLCRRPVAYTDSNDPGLNDVAGGNYSALTVRFDLAREVGHYIMDYFVPSILLVVVSWVSFWLDPNAVPGRTTLGKH